MSRSRTRVWMWVTAGTLGMGLPVLWAQPSPYMPRGSSAKPASAVSPYQSAAATLPAATPAKFPWKAAATATYAGPMPQLLKPPAGVTPPAVVEQASFSRPRGRDGHYLITPDDFARLAEYRVVLAWLADPLTCPLTLQAQASDSFLEVSGTVPSHAVKVRVIDLASQHAGKPVLDSIAVRPGLELRPLPDAADNLRTRCLEALAHGPGKVVFDQHLDVDSGGKVTVRGTIPSYEEKLAVSHCVRQLRGCTCIDNQLTVWGFSDAGVAYALVTADGRHLTPTEPAASQPRITPIAASPAPASPTWTPSAMPSPSADALARIEHSASGEAAPPSSPPRLGIWFSRPKSIRYLPAMTAFVPPAASAKPTAGHALTPVATPSPSTAHATARPWKMIPPSEPSQTPATMLTPSPYASVPQTITRATAIAASSNATSLVPAVAPVAVQPATPPLPSSVVTVNKLPETSPLPVPPVKAVREMGMAARGTVVARSPGQPSVARSPGRPSAPPDPATGTMALSRHVALRLPSAMPSARPAVSGAASRPAEDSMPAPATIAQAEPPPSRRTAASVTTATTVSAANIQPFSPYATATQTAQWVPARVGTSKVIAGTRAPVTPYAVQRVVPGRELSVVEVAYVAKTPATVKPRAATLERPAVAGVPRQLATTVRDHPVPPVTTDDPLPPSGIQTAFYEEKPAALGSETVTSGVIILTGADESPDLLAEHIQTWLTHLVLCACGNEASDVKIMLLSNSEMRVQLYLRDPQASKRLARKIMALPELSPYHVTLEMQVKP